MWYAYWFDWLCCSLHNLLWEDHNERYLCTLLLKHLLHFKIMLRVENMEILLRREGFMLFGFCFLFLLFHEDGIFFFLVMVRWII